MPRQAKDKRWNPSSIYGRRANISLGGVAGVLGAGASAAENPAFDPSAAATGNPGDADFNNSSFDANTFRQQQPFADTRNFWDKISGKPNLAEQQNIAFRGGVNTAQAGNALERQEAPVVNPSLLYQDKNPNGILPPYGSSGSNVQGRILPFSGSSLGSTKGNAEFASKLAQSDNDIAAAAAKERGLLGVRKELMPDIVLNERIASEGLDPSKSKQYAQSNENPFLRRNEANASSYQLQNEQNLGQMDTAQDLSRATSGKALNDATYDFGASGQPDYMQAFVKNTLAKLATTGLANQNLSDIKLSPAETLIRGGQQYTGLVPESKQFQNSIQDPKTKISIPYGPIQTTHSYLPSRVSPFSSGEIPANNLNTAAPTNKGNILPTISGQLQGPPNPFGLDLNLRQAQPPVTTPAPQPSSYVPPASGMSPTSVSEWPNLLLQEYMRMKKAFSDNLQGQ